MSAAAAAVVVLFCPVGDLCQLLGQLHMWTGHCYWSVMQPPLWPGSSCVRAFRGCAVAVRVCYCWRHLDLGLQMQPNKGGCCGVVPGKHITAIACRNHFSLPSTSPSPFPFATTPTPHQTLQTSTGAPASADGPRPRQRLPPHPGRTGAAPAGTHAPALPQGTVS